MAELNVSVNPSGAVAGSAVANRSIASIGTTATATQGQLAGLASQLFSLKGAMILGAGAGVYGLARAFKSGINEAAKFETGLVGVAKTTGLAGKELDLLAKKITQASKDIPVTTGELLELGQAAGQMGITGVENIEKFSITVAKLGRASDLAGAEAATALARILTVTGENISEIDTLASVIVSLGNNVAATESEIAGMTTRVAQATSAFELGSTQSAALSAALVALGVRAEAGGTAMGQTFKGLTDAINGTREDLEEFAGALDMDPDKFQKLFSTDKIKGFEYFLENVAELGDSAGMALENAGLGGIRLANSIIPLAKNMEVYAKTQRLANAEAENAVALNREFEATTKTFESQLIRTGNVLADISKTIGNQLLPALTTALTVFNDWAADDGVSTMLNTLSTAGTIFAGVLVAKLVPAVVATTASYVKNTQAAWAKQAATMKALQAQVAHTGAVAADTKAQVAATRAEIARATSMQHRLRLQALLFQAETRNTAATAAHTSALQAQAAAAATSRASLFTLANAANVALAAFIGWEIGSYLREEFDVVKKAGIALMGGLHTAAIEIEGQFKLMGAGIERAFTNPLDVAQDAIVDFFEWLAGLTPGLLRALGLEGMADALTADFSDLRSKTYEEHQANLEAIRKATQDEVTAVQDIYAEMFAFVGNEGKTTIDKVGAANKDVQKAFAEAGEAMFDSWIAGLPLIGKTGEALENAAGNAGGLADEFKTFTENFRTDEQRLELFSQKLLFLNEKFNEGEISLATYNNAVIALNGSISDLIPEAEKLSGTDFGLGAALNTALGEMEEALKESERAAEQWNKIWDNAVDNMQREFGETIHGALWDDGIKSFGDFADSLLDIWKRMISEMIAAWMVNGIAGLFSGQGIGGFSLGGFSIGSGGTGGGIGGTAISAGISKAFKSSGIGEAVKSGLSSVGAKLGIGSGAETFALGAQTGQIAGVPLVAGNLAGTQAGAVQALTSNAAYTGAGTGTSASAGGAAGWGAAGLAIPFVAGQIIKELKIGGFGDTPEYVKALRDMKNSDAIGVQGGVAGQGERGGFFRGQNAGFVSQFAQNSGANTVGGGGRVGQGLADNYGAVSFQGMDLENVIQLLGEAQREFDAVQKSAVTAMKASGNEVNRIGEAMQNGIIEPVELASFGWIELGERITNTKDGTARYTDLTVDSFNKINQAVNSGEIRMEALRGAVVFNQKEIQALERIGVGAAGTLERAFGSAEQRVYALGEGGARSFGIIGRAAVQAANDANSAFSSIAVPGGGRSFGVNPAQNAVNTNRIPGLASGGSFMVGGEYGRDNNIVQFKASRGERVTVETPQQQKSGTNVQVNVYAPEGSSVERRERDGPDGKALDIIIDNAVANNLSRAGSRTANSLSRTYGSSRQLRRR